MWSYDVRNTQKINILNQAYSKKKKHQHEVTEEKTPGNTFLARGGAREK